MCLGPVPADWKQPSPEAVMAECQRRLAANCKFLLDYARGAQMTPEEFAKLDAVKRMIAFFSEPKWN